MPWIACSDGRLSRWRLSVRELSELRVVWAGGEEVGELSVGSVSEDRLRLSAIGRAEMGEKGWLWLMRGK